jgi:hypothetical protein
LGLSIEDTGLGITVLNFYGDVAVSSKEDMEDFVPEEAIKASRVSLTAGRERVPKESQ